MLCRRLAVLIVAIALASSIAAQSHTFTHFAGSTGGGGFEDGIGAAVRFSYPSGVAVDASGSLYVADADNHTIRKITGNAVTTLAGLTGVSGGRDGTGYRASFNLPNAVAVDVSGNVYVADTVNGRVRKITRHGAVTTLTPFLGAIFGIAVDSAGNVYVVGNAVLKIDRTGALTTIAGALNEAGSSDGIGGAARFRAAHGVAVDAAGNLYVADSGNNTIRKVTPDGLVATIAGQAGPAGSADGPASMARFDYPTGIAVAPDGVVYVADSFNHTIRKIDRTGLVSTYAGAADVEGSADGPAAAARLLVPQGLAIDATGNLFVCDSFNATIRRIGADGVVTTIAGQAVEAGSRDANGGDARFDRPSDVAVDDSGNVYVADSFNHTIRKITPAGDVTTLAGLAGAYGSADGRGSLARFAYPSGIAVDRSGVVYVGDSENHTIRKITPAGDVTTLAGLAGVSGSSDGPGSAARFLRPKGLAVDAKGNIYVADSGNHTIRQITAEGVVSTLAGLAGVAGSTDGAASAARFNDPQDVAVTREPHDLVKFLVADTGNHTLRVMFHAGNVVTWAGTAGETGSTSGQSLRSARFTYPYGVAFHPDHGIYIADTGNNSIREIVGTSFSVGYAGGDPSVAGSSDGIESRFNAPLGIDIDRTGTIYVADARNHCIRKASPARTMAYIDSWKGFVGQTRQLRAEPQTAAAYKWEIIRRPSGSTAELSSATSPTPTFVPDLPDRYVFRLTATSAAGTTVTDTWVDATANPRRRSASH